MDIEEGNAHDDETQTRTSLTTIMSTLISCYLQAALRSSTRIWTDLQMILTPFR